jgi:hypothetical protein
MSWRAASRRDLFHTLGAQEKSPLLICSQRRRDKKFGGANKSWLSTMEPEYRSLGAHNPIFRGHLFARARRLLEYILCAVCLCANNCASHDTSNQYIGPHKTTRNGTSSKF